MRTDTKIYKVYTYGELSADAKENVKQWYLEDCTRTEEFTDSCLEDLKELFNADLEVQYSLSSCQGDGFNIYGELYAEDVFNCLEQHKGGTQLAEFESILTEKEKKTILNYSKVCGKIKLAENQRYCYSLADYIDIVDDWEYQLDNYYNYKNINTDVLKKFEELTRDIFGKLCDGYEKSGYKFFYEIEDEDLKEICDANNYEFLEDGTFYC